MQHFLGAGLYATSLDIAASMKDRRHIGYQGLPRLLGVLAVLALAGCSGSDLVPLRGQLLHQDGTPLVAARVTARSDKTGKWATGNTNAEGRFDLGIEGGQGLPPGDYYVLVVENRGNMENPIPPTIHPKYADPGTSGLTVSIAANEPAELNAKLDPPS